MTRRTAIPVVLLIPRALGGSPHKDMAEAGNDFIHQWKQWADEVNNTPLGGISASAMLYAQEMDKRYRKFQKLRRKWEVGE
jgi:hypothetical protein